MKELLLKARRWRRLALFPFTTAALISVFVPLKPRLFPLPFLFWWLGVMGWEISWVFKERGLHQFVEQIKHTRVKGVK